MKAACSYKSYFRKIKSPSVVDRSMIIKAFSTIPSTMSGEKSTDDTIADIPNMERLITQSTIREAEAEIFEMLPSKDISVPLNRT